MPAESTRRFVATTSLELLVELHEEDIYPGDNPADVAAAIAEQIPLADWTTMGVEISEMPQ